MKASCEKFPPFPGLKEWLSFKEVIYSLKTHLAKYPDETGSKLIIIQAMLAEQEKQAAENAREFRKRIIDLLSQETPSPVTEQEIENHLKRETWTEKQAADFLGYNPVYLGQLRRARNGPPFYKVGERRIMYRAKDVREWIAKDEIHPVPRNPKK